MRRVLLLLIVGAVLAAAAVFLELAESVRENELVVRTDRRVLDFVTRHRVGWLTRVARVVTLLGNTWVVAFVIAGAAIVLVVQRRRLDALLVSLSAIGTALLVATVKHAVGRSRPPSGQRLVAASGAAFPSGHAAQSVACYAALAVVVTVAAPTKRTGVIACAGAAAIALAVGGSRVYLGVHWLSDVVSGWLLAGGWLLALVGFRFAVGGSPTRSSQDAQP